MLKDKKHGFLEKTLKTEAAQTGHMSYYLQG